jgi:hypothetical protein
MIAFASEIQTTLTNLKGGSDASILETIKELTDGSKVREAMEIAKGYVIGVRYVTGSFVH